MLIHTVHIGTLIRAQAAAFRSIVAAASVGGAAVGVDAEMV